MSKKNFNVDIDLNNNQILEMVLEKLASDPASPVAGRMYYNTTSNVVRYFDGTEWISITLVPSISNVGSGSGVYKGVNGNTLEFYSLKSTNNLISIAIVSNELQLTFNQANIAHQSISGAGTNTHAQIDAHIANTSNPHNTTKAQVGLGSVDNVQQLPLSYLDIDAALASNSDVRVPSQKAVKAFVENKLAGLSWKDNVRAATTANGALATAFANGQSIDGVTLATGDRILIKNQTTGSENGIYVVNASGSPTRAADAATGDSLINASVFVSEGTNNADTAWTCNNNTITIGTTAIAWVQFSGAGTYQAGSGLNLSGNTFSVSGLTTSHFAAGVVDTTTTLGTSDAKLPTQKAVKAYVDSQVSVRADYYKATISAAGTGTVLASAHGCGIAPMVQVFETVGGVSSPVEVEISVSSIGDITWNSNAAFSGYLVIIGV